MVLQGTFFWEVGHGGGVGACGGGGALMAALGAPHGTGCCFLPACLPACLANVILSDRDSKPMIHES